MEQRTQWDAPEHQKQVELRVRIMISGYVSFLSGIPLREQQGILG